jgi:hypothetical protein
MIYFAQGEMTKRIKIGYTSGDPKGRFRALQTGSPDRLTLVAVMDGDVKEERELHRRFGKYRLFGEWFEPHPELIEFITEGKPNPILDSGKLCEWGDEPWAVVKPCLNAAMRYCRFCPEHEPDDMPIN